MHLRNFGNHVTVRPPAAARPPVHPHHMYTNIENNSINRYGNPNVTQGFIWKEIAWTPVLLERKKQQQRRVFFDVIFDVYTHADNRERAIASD